LCCISRLNSTLVVSHSSTSRSICCAGSRALDLGISRLPRSGQGTGDGPGAWVIRRTLWDDGVADLRQRAVLKLRLAKPGLARDLRRARFYEAALPELREKQRYGKW
jgi:hypothetical protein